MWTAAWYTSAVYCSPRNRAALKSTVGEGDPADRPSNSAPYYWVLTEIFFHYSLAQRGSHEQKLGEAGAEALRGRRRAKNRRGDRPSQDSGKRVAAAVIISRSHCGRNAMLLGYLLEAPTTGSRRALGQGYETSNSAR